MNIKISSNLNHQPINLSESNTHFIIDSEIILSNDTTIGNNVTIEFKPNGIIKGDSSGIQLIAAHTRIIAPPVRIFDDNIEPIGFWMVDKAFPQWFGAVSYTPHLYNEGSNEQIIFEASNCDSTFTDILQLQDSSTAINKAIRMKRQGEVFLHRGIYIVDNSIEIPAGISLTGECESSLKSKIIQEAQQSYTLSENYVNTNITHFNGSIIIFDRNRRSNNLDYLVKINISPDSDSWDYQYNTQATRIKNIRFQNNSKTLTAGYIPTAILIGGTAELDHIIWCDFPCAVKQAYVYSDNKRITNCTYFNSTDYTVENGSGEDSQEYRLPGEKPYAFDLTGNGDSLIFQHNAIHENSPKNYGLLIRSCGGGLISDNIINADVDIFYSKGITFESNHIEGGAQIRILSSSIDIRNNYIHKEKNIPFIFAGDIHSKTSVINFSNNNIIFRSFHNIGYPDTPSDIEPSDIPYNIVPSANKYDLLITKGTSINIQDSFVYWLEEMGIGDSRPTGLTICKSEMEYDPQNSPHILFPFEKILYGVNGSLPAYSDFTKFNDISYIGSRKSQILKFHLSGISKTVNKTDLGYPIIGVWDKPINHFQFNSGIYWRPNFLAKNIAHNNPYNNFQVKYSYQVIWDKTRRLVSKNLYPSQMGNPYLFYLGELQLQDHSYGGALFAMMYHNLDLNTTIRIFRECWQIPPTINGSGDNFIETYMEEPSEEVNEDISMIHALHYVDIPLCGANFLYDNGCTISGYHWIPFEKVNGENPMIITPFSDSLSKIDFCDNNVTCYLESISCTENDLTTFMKEGDKIVYLQNGNVVREHII